MTKKEQQVKSAKIMAVLKYSANQPKTREAKKAALLQKYEDQRGGFKIGKI
ncbi:hypothetical protein [Enterococcus asini]|uniref:hypothetical protein n=1 Tax=Enterococcus asini TaxID=57732 RepID=UPI0032E4441C